MPATSFPFQNHTTTLWRICLFYHGLCAHSYLIAKLIFNILGGFPPYTTLYFHTFHAILFSSFHLYRMAWFILRINSLMQWTFSPLLLLSNGNCPVCCCLWDRQTVILLMTHRQLRFVWGVGKGLDILGALVVFITTSKIKLFTF